MTRFPEYCFFMVSPLGHSFTVPLLGSALQLFLAREDFPSSIFLFFVLSVLTCLSIHLNFYLTRRNSKINTAIGKCPVLQPFHFCLPLYVPMCPDWMPDKAILKWFYACGHPPTFDVHLHSYVLVNNHRKRIYGESLMHQKKILRGIPKTSTSTSGTTKGR